LLQGWVKQFGNIKFLILSIGTVVFFTLLLVTGNTMAISVRERTNELGVLKAIGFPDRTSLDSSWASRWRSRLPVVWACCLRWSLFQ
jgi:hypothetical protein